MDLETIELEVIQIKSLLKHTCLYIKRNERKKYYIFEICSTAVGPSVVLYEIDEIDNEIIDNKKIFDRVKAGMIRTNWDAFKAALEASAKRPGKDQYDVVFYNCRHVVKYALKELKFRILAFYIYGTDAFNDSLQVSLVSHEDQAQDEKIKFFDALHSGLDFIYKVLKDDKIKIALVSIFTLGLPVCAGNAGNRIEGLGVQNNNNNIDFLINVSKV